MFINHDLFAADIGYVCLSNHIINVIMIIKHSIMNAIM